MEMNKTGNREMHTIRQWRRLMDKSQAEMANALKVHVNTYSNWEKNPAIIRIGDLIKIADALEVDVNSIITDASENSVQ